MFPCRLSAPPRAVGLSGESGCNLQPGFPSKATAEEADREAERVFTPASSSEQTQTPHVPGTAVSGGPQCRSGALLPGTRFSEHPQLRERHAPRWPFRERLPSPEASGPPVDSRRRRARSACPGVSAPVQMEMPVREPGGTAKADPERAG